MSLLGGRRCTASSTELVSETQTTGEARQNGLSVARLADAAPPKAVVLHKSRIVAGMPLVICRQAELIAVRRAREVRCERRRRVQLDTLRCASKIGGNDCCQSAETT